MERISKCLCGQLTINVKGDPFLTVVCNCTNCQRRTGSVFSTNTYFKQDEVLSQVGQSKHCTLVADSGRTIVSRFCPDCGSTLSWEAEMFPGLIGFAVGTFNDPNFPKPQVVGFKKSKCHWVNFPQDMLHLEGQDVPPEIAKQFGLA